MHGAAGVQRFRDGAGSHGSGAAAKRVRAHARAAKPVQVCARHRSVGFFLKARGAHVGRPPQALAALVRVKAGSEAMLSGYASHARRRVANRQGARQAGQRLATAAAYALDLGKKVRGAQGLFWRGVVTVERLSGLERSCRSMGVFRGAGTSTFEARHSQSTRWRADRKRECTVYECCLLLSTTRPQLRTPRQAPQAASGLFSSPQRPIQVSMPQAPPLEPLELRLVTLDPVVVHGHGLAALRSGLSPSADSAPTSS